jgi:hypothetical protein
MKRGKDHDSEEEIDVVKDIEAEHLEMTPAIPDSEISPAAFIFK